MITLTKILYLATLILGSYTFVNLVLDRWTVMAYVGAATLVCYVMALGADMAGRDEWD